MKNKIAWAFSVLLIITGFEGLIDNPFYSIFIILFGLSFNPKINVLIKNKKLKYVIPIVLFLLCCVLVPDTSTLSISVEEKQKTTEKTVSKVEVKKEDEEEPKEKDPTSPSDITVADVPAYTSSPTVNINNNEPEFEVYEVEEATTSYEFYADLDSLGRATYAMASISDDLMPTEDRESISSVTPSGWDNESYSCVSGGWLYNRSHLIGFQLTGENANNKNLITGTRYMNVEGMLPYENIIANFVKSTDYHVLYRVTPIYEGDNLVASGVQLEAQSVEDNGEGLSFNVYCYNVQPGVNINYANGDNSGTASCPLTSEQQAMQAQSQSAQQSEPVQQAPVQQEQNTQMVWIASSGNGTKYHSNPNCSRMKNPIQISIQDAQNQNFEPCKKCY